MLFKAKPFYNVHLGTLVRFNSIGEFETDNQELIDKLMGDPNVSIAGEQKVEQPKEDKKDVVAESIEEISEQSDIEKLREDYKAKFGKKPFAGWNAEQLQEKLA